MTIRRGRERKRKHKHLGEIPKIEHGELVDRAFLYLQYAFMCSVVFKERRASTRERPDAIGFWGGGFSYLIECKSSRADFLADGKKFFRQRPVEGMGFERYFMAPVGLLEPEEMPAGWGLLEVYEKPPRAQNRPVEVAKESEVFDDGKRNLQAEISFLVSAMRRLNISMAVFVDREETMGGEK